MQPSLAKRILFYLIFLVINGVIVFGLGEVVVRLMGYKVYRVSQSGHIKIEPGGREYQSHELLGYSHIAGKFTYTIKDSFVHTVTHRENTLRITHPLADDSLYRDKAKLWLMGCSFMHGAALNDEETLAWLLQENYKDHEVINFGVNGYGTIHFLLQIREALKTRQKPALIIIGYASFHDQRNVFTFDRRKALYQNVGLEVLEQPYARFDNSGRLKIFRSDIKEFNEWPLIRYSAFMNALQDKYIYLKDKHIDERLVTLEILREIHRICQQEEIPLLIANVYEPDDIDRFCRDNGIPFTDITVDLSLPEHNCLPYDSHPSALANKKFATKLIGFIDRYGLL